jgi:hypothetical protein
MSDLSDLGEILVAWPTSDSPGENPGNWLAATKRHVYSALAMIGDEDARFVRAPLGHLVHINGSRTGSAATYRHIASPGLYVRIPPNTLER